MPQRASKVHGEVTIVKQACHCCRLQKFVCYCLSVVIVCAIFVSWPSCPIMISWIKLGLQFLIICQCVLLPNKTLPCCRRNRQTTNASWLPFCMYFKLYTRSWFYPPFVACCHSMPVHSTPIDSCLLNTSTISKIRSL